jgi:hypothetical protein
LCCWEFEGSKGQNRKIVCFFVVNFESPLKEEEEKVVDVFRVS